MKRLNGVRDQKDRAVTYELEGGLRVRLSADDVEQYGAGECIRRMGLGEYLPTMRLRVYEPGDKPTVHGRFLGTLPPDFDPQFIKTRSFLYDPRPGDIVRKGDALIVSPTLGPGDLEAIVGFIPSTHAEEL